jgi:hypothetical protein
MLRTIIFAAAIAVPNLAHAADCTLSDARYTQDDAAWWLTLKRVPRFAPVNQVAAFYLELPNSGVTLEGAISVPNGFGSPLWRISGPCGPDSAESCQFLEDYEHPSAYGLYGNRIGFFEHGEGAVVPDQLILPGVARALWYSNLRTEWDDNADGPGDAFKLVGCD